MIDAAAVLFPLCLLFLLVFSTKKDRVALWIVTLSNLVGWLLVIFVTRQIHAPWKLVVPAAGETLTIFSLVVWGQNRSSFIQAVLLLIAWCAHVQCYADLIWNINVVYDHYEQILAGVALAQLIGFYDTWFSIFRAVQKWYSLWVSGGRVVSPASRSSAVVRDPDEPHI